MRVAFLSANAIAGDAIGNQIAERVGFFADRGADLRVFLTSTERLHPGVRSYAQIWDGLPSSGPQWKFLASADLVFADFGHHHPLLELLPLLAGERPRLVVDYHGITPAALGDAQHREMLERGERDRGLVRDADLVIVHSRFTERELLGATGLPPARTVRLGFPIDADVFAPGPPGRDLRRELGLPTDAAILLFVGRVAPSKNLPLLVDALALLSSRTPAVHAVIVGDTGDVYQAEAERCRSRAAKSGVADRLHFLGRVNEEQLRDAYRSADVFVTPSRHEGFCIPVLEAMACGVPVVAARTTALPETVGGAGLTFAPDDAAELTRQVARVIDDSHPSPRSGEGEKGSDPASLSGPRRGGAPLRIALVADRYGPGVIGGAETSLRTIAETLRQSGHTVEVFTTERSTELGDLPVRSFRVDRIDRERYAAAERTVAAALGSVDPKTETAYLDNLPRSTALLAELAGRIDDFDAVLTGPYLSGLALDVARKFPEKTVLVPCFHDEPAARLPALLAAYREVGAVLYHSPEEQEFARAELGVHRPRSTVCGSWLDTTALGDPDRGRRLLGADGRFLLSCGRRSPHKNVPLLIDFARRYDAARPGRFRFVFVGAGEVVIPHEPWARDLGVLDDSTRRDVAAAADALVQLSQRESLSLAALEAWTQGVPVIVHAGCPVLAGHIERSQGGRTVGDYESFAAALDHLWERPEHWRKLGSRGQAYTRAGFGSRDALADRVTGAIRELTVPLAEVMRQRGLERARLFRRDVWRDRFAAEIERVLDAPPLPARLRVEVEPRCTERTASPNAGGVAVPVRVHNRGTRPAHAEGPARIVLRYRVEDGPVGAAVSLPGLIVPESALPASVWVSVPERTGVYRLFLWAEEEATGRAIGASVEVRLVVGAEAGGSSPTPDVVQAPLAAAERLQSLPADYVDVTTGRFAALKRWLKSKLLNNFRRAYLDVLSRQQSAFNRQVLAVLNELVEWCARLEHGGGRTVTETVRSQWLAAERRCAALEERVARLEAQLQPEEVRT